MRKLNLKNWMLFAILCVSLTNCTPKPPDVFVFKSLEQALSFDQNGNMKLMPSPTCMKEVGEFECGYGVAIMSGKEIFVGDKPEHLFNGKTWSELKAESILLPAKESYAPLADYIINSCKKMNCDKEVGKFKVKLDQVKDQQ